MIKTLKNMIKKNDTVFAIAMKAYLTPRKILSSISPELQTKWLYKKTFNKKIDLDNPKTFSEKISWLKLNTYSNNPLVTECADKYEVRKYVERCGLGFLLNDLIDVWESVDEIDWNKLPNKFALKGNHGSGHNLICNDKSKLDIKKAEKELNRWLADASYWKIGAELNYKNIPRKLICEKFLDTKDGNLPADYKIYCFNGVPKAILYMQERGKNTKAVFMDISWEFLGEAEKYEKNNEELLIPNKPKSLNVMLNSAKKLSESFPFVRVDFYENNDSAIFGELTFTPAGGMGITQTEVDGYNMGELLDISKEQLLIN